MFVQERRKNPRNIAMILDILHIVVGILVVICAVFAFLNPERHQFLFPVIFLLSSLLNGVNGWFKWRESGRDRKRKMNAVFSCAIAALLLLIGLISAVSIWR